MIYCNIFNNKTSIPQAHKWASAYTGAEDRPVLDMSQGVPGIPPPSILLDALGQAAASPQTCGYCPVTGETSLRSALALEMRSIYGADSDIHTEDIALTAGCNMAFVTAIMSVADAGDQVILPVPW